MFFLEQFPLHAHICKSCARSTLLVIEFSYSNRLTEPRKIYCIIFWNTSCTGLTIDELTFGYKYGKNDAWMNRQWG